MATTSGSNNQLSLLDRVAIITGASRGIGKAIALHLASLGAKLVINYTSPSSQPLAQEIVTQINSLSNAPRAVEFWADVSDPAQVKALFDTAQEAFQAQPHILISNAGITPDKPSTIANTAVSDFDRVHDVNARGTFLCIKEAANRIKRGGGGRIETVSSSLTATFLPSSVAYTASKAAVEAMTKVLAKELRGTGITANCVARDPP